MLAAISLSAISCSILASPSVSTLYTFTQGPGTLVQDASGNLYGTTSIALAGSSGTGTGTVFQLSPTGTLTILHAFSMGGPTNADGVQPSALLLDASGALYGAATYGGTNGNGTVFQISGGAFATLHSFAPSSNDPEINADGLSPNGLIRGVDGNLYGIAHLGGPYGNGTVFRISADGTFALIYSFSAGIPNSFPPTNADGAEPVTLVPAPGGDLYGVTSAGGPAGLGTVFRLTTAGVLTTMYGFTGQSDGSTPTGLTLARDGNFYGTTRGVDGANAGTFFRITPAGVFTTLFWFSGRGSPEAAPVEGPDGVFFGTSVRSGTTYSTPNGFDPLPLNYLSIFSINSAGSLSWLYTFPGAVGGQGNPSSLLPAVTDPTGTFYGGTGVSLYALTLSAPSQGPAAAPGFDRAGGTYTLSQTEGLAVTLTDTSVGTDIYYTTDGSTPTTASTVYSGPIQLTAASTTLRAIAAGGPYQTSPVATATYEIVGGPLGNGSGGGGSFDDWGVVVLGSLAALRGLSRAPRQRRPL